MNVLDFIATVYSYLGMDFALKLSTRPETALGDAEALATYKAELHSSCDFLLKPGAAPAPPGILHGREAGRPGKHIKRRKLRLKRARALYRATLSSYSKGPRPREQQHRTTRGPGVRCALPAVAHPGRAGE